MFGNVKSLKTNNLLILWFSTVKKLLSTIFCKYYLHGSNIGCFDTFTQVLVWPISGKQERTFNLLWLREP